MYERLLNLIAAAVAAGLLDDEAGTTLRTTVEAMGTDETRSAIPVEALAAADPEGILMELFAHVRAGEVEGVPADDIETLRELGDVVLAMRAEQTARGERAAATEAELAELEAALNPAAPAEGEGEGDAEAEAAAVAEAERIAAEAAAAPEAVTASAPSLATLARSQPAASRPAPQAGPGYELTGPDGQRVSSLHELAALTADAFTHAAGQHTERAGGDRLARMRFTHPEHRRLYGDRGDVDKMQAVVADAGNPDHWDEAVVASGGFCAEAEVDYRHPVVSEADRPVRDGLPSFALPRGSVQVPTPPNLESIIVSDDASDPAAAVSVWCNDVDENPAGRTKGVQTIDCSDFDTFTACALVRRLRWGNFGAMALPENVEAWQTLVLAAWARKGDSRLLTQIKAASTQRTTPQAFGAARDLAEAVARAAAQVRSFHRTRADYRFRVLLPEWAVTLGSVDLLRGLQSDPAFVTDAERLFREMLSDAGVNVTLYRDTPSTGTSQVLSLGAGPVLSPWPTEVQWGLFPEGRFSFGNMETLDLGIYRSPELNDTNDVENFAESFEVVIDHGQGSALWVTSTVCPDGTSGAGVDVAVCGS